MKHTVAILALTAALAWSLDMATLLHHLPAYPDRYYCILESSSSSRGRKGNALQSAYETISEYGQQQIVVTSADGFLVPSKKFTHFLVSFDSWAFCERQVDRSFVQMSWNNVGYFIFLGESGFSRDVVVSYANLMKNGGIIRSVLIFPDGLFFGYDYFKSKILEFSSEEGLIEHLRNNHLQDVEGYILQVSVLDYYLSISIKFEPFSVKGPTAMIMKVFADHLNATLLWQLQSWPRTELNYQVLHNKIDIITNLVFNSPFVESFYENQYDGMVLLVPERLRESFFKQLLVPFTVELWIFLAILTIVFMALNYVLSDILPHNMILMVFFGSATSEHDLPRVDRFFFLALSILVFLLCEAYLAKIFYFLLNVEYEPHFETLQEFEQSTIPLCADFEIGDAYRKFIIDLSPYLEKKLILQNNAKEWYDVTSCSWLLLNQMAEQFVTYKTNHDPMTLRTKFYMLPQVLSWQPRIHSISRTGPFFGEFSRIHRWISESGLFDKWKDQANSEYVQRKWGALAVLGFDDLMSLWLILGYGYGLSSVGFIGEVIIKALSSKLDLRCFGGSRVEKIN